MCFIPFGKKFYPENIKKDEELKEKTIGEELGRQPDTGAGSLKAARIRRFSHDNSKPGSFVEGISKDDIQDIYEIRSLLEGLCAKKAVTGITDKELEELEENLYLTEFHIQKEHFEQILELDNRFHEILYEASKSKMLKHVLSDFHHYVERYGRFPFPGQNVQRSRTRNIKGLSRL